MNWFVFANLTVSVSVQFKLNYDVFFENTTVCEERNLFLETLIYGDHTLSSYLPLTFLSDVLVLRNALPFHRQRLSQSVQRNCSILQKQPDCFCLLKDTDNYKSARNREEFALWQAASLVSRSFPTHLGIWPKKKD